MNEKLAKEIIKEALNLAIQKGCYNLIEVTNIVNALTFLNNEDNGESPDNQ
jgi:hypothetical protein